MKNIHILPTDNPSRLYLHSNNELQLRTNIIRTSEDYLGTNQNMFITSDEEFKVEDWVIEFQKGDDIGEVHFINSEYVIAGDIQKKIILTTDFTLAPDVHKISDEFLEWFVKNPSCEEVGVELKTKQLVRPYDVYNETVSYYKIIIPKEEPKQLTLEEEAEKYSREVWGVYYDDVHPDIAITQTQGEISVKDFSRGAKWQAKRMYSEEEVIKILLAKNTELGIIEKTSEVVEFFEQFKKN